MKKKVEKVLGVIFYIFALFVVLVFGSMLWRYGDDSPLYGKIITSLVCAGAAVLFVGGTVALIKEKKEVQK